MENNNEQALRQAGLSRKTNETDIKLSLNVDGSGVSELETDVPFLNHMLDLFTKHGQFDLSVQARGDIEIDDHHTVEDIGICLGRPCTKHWVIKKESNVMRVFLYRWMRRWRRL